MLRKPDERALKPVRGRPRDPERSRRILEAARAHFYAHGLERTSVHAIAAEAGVSKMTIYSNFGSKEGLFEAVVRERTDRMMGGLAAVETLDPQQLEKSLTMIGEQFLMLTRDDDAIGKLRTVYGAAGSQPEACRAFYRHGPERLTNELAVHLRPTHAAGTLKMRNPLQAADLFLSMFLGSGHIRGLLKLEMPDPRENKALLREAVRVFLAAYAVTR